MLVKELCAADLEQIRCVPTSLQIKTAAEAAGLPLVEPDQVSNIDVAFDGADQIDMHGFLVKGGGGALLRENIVFDMANKVYVIADASKFVKTLNMPIPVEVHPAARALVAHRIVEVGGKPTLRKLDRGYPLFTENGNIIFDCDFGRIHYPKRLARNIASIGGVMGVGLFVNKKPHIYKARGRSYEEIRF